MIASDQTVRVTLEDDGKPGVNINGRMVFTEDAEGTGHLVWDAKGTGRSCGSCTLCCRLVPVKEIFKKAGEKCRHQSHAKGCRIYPTRPRSCQTWSCRWLCDPRTKGLPRPDRAHYVIDLQYDTLTTVNEQTGEHRHSSVMQIWVDPKVPDAHRAPDLRAFMAMMAETMRVPTIVRWDSERALIIVPPALHAGDTFLEFADARMLPREQHQQLVERTLNEQDQAPPPDPHVERPGPGRAAPSTPARGD